VPSFPLNYGLIFGLGAVVLALSAVAFGLIREPAAPLDGRRQERFAHFLGAGWHVLKRDRRFRFFTYYQLATGLTTMAFPFYVLQARQVSGLPQAAVGTLLAAQQVGSVVLNPLWGAWGDHVSKLSLLKGLSWTAALTPAIALVVPPLTVENVLGSQQVIFIAYAIIFFFIGGLLSGETTGYLVYLMEISPDGRRADYSGYMNAFVAPARLLPLLAGALVDLISFRLLFATTLLSVVGRLWLLNQLAQSSDK